MSIGKGQSDAMKYTHLQTHKKGAVASILLDAPRTLNAFDETMCDEVLAALQQASADPEVRAVVLSGAGRIFSAGGDVKEMAEVCRAGCNILERTVTKIDDIVRLMLTMPKPIIASVFGAVYGAAFNLALACDLCIASEDAAFCQAFWKIGLVPDAGGLFLLSRTVGIRRAMQLAMLGTPVSAAEGKALGFVCEVCERDALPHRTQVLAERLAAGPTYAYGQMKSLLYASQFTDLDAYLKQEASAQYACGFTEDYRTGIFSFLEKREPEFQGK